MAMPGLRRAILDALRDFGEGATSFDRNAASVLTPVTSDSALANRAQQAFQRGARAEDLWNDLGVTTNPAPERFDRPPVWLRPRSMADVRLGDEEALAGSDLDAFAPGVPLPPNLRSNVFVGPDPDDFYPNAFLSMSRSSLSGPKEYRIGIGSKPRDDLSLHLSPGGRAPPELAHELQHVAADWWPEGAIPQGTNMDAAHESAALSRVVGDALSGQRKLVSRLEDQYWTLDGNAREAAKSALERAKTELNRLTQDPEFARSMAAYHIYRNENGEQLARWAQRASNKSLADIKTSPHPYAEGVASLFHRGEPLPEYWVRRFEEDQRGDGRENIRRLGRMFGVLSVGGAGLGLSMGATREALRNELNREEI